MNIPEVVAYITIGYIFVTLLVLSVLSRNNISIEKKGGVIRKNRDTYKKNEDYRKAA